MKRLIFYPLFFTLLISCTDLVTLRPQYDSVDPVLQPYVKQIPFKIKSNAGFSELDGWLDNIRKKFDKGNVIGFCSTTLLPPGYEVNISPEFWARATDLQKVALVVHEYFHCEHDFKHDHRLRSDGCAYSIMYPSLESDWCLRRYWVDYMREIKVKAGE